MSTEKSPATEQPCLLKHGTQGQSLFPAFAENEVLSTPWVELWVPTGGGCVWAAPGIYAGGAVWSGRQGWVVFPLYFLFLKGKSNHKFLRGAT